MICRCGTEMDAVNNTDDNMLIGCPECGHLYEISPTGAPELKELDETKVICHHAIEGKVGDLKFQNQERLWDMLGIVTTIK